MLVLPSEHLTAKVMTTGHDKHLVNRKKALNLYKRYFERDRPHSNNFITVYCSTLLCCCSSLNKPNLYIYIYLYI